MKQRYFVLFSAIIVLLLTITFLVQAAQAAGQQSLSSSDSQLASTVMPKKTVNGGAVYFADSLDVPKGTTLEFTEPSTVIAGKVNLHPGSQLFTHGNSLQIVALEQFCADQSSINVAQSTTILTPKGSDGPKGPDGHKAMDALKGATGGPGTDAGDGVAGGDGQAVQIIAPVICGNLSIVTTGGTGGDGGNAGNGGSGGKGFSGSDARTLYYFRNLDNIPMDTLLKLGISIGVPYVGEVLAILSIFNGMKIGDGFDGFNGGSGGKGGKGGNGGHGGSGGAVHIMFGVQVAGTSMMAYTQGGAGGAAGAGGLGGAAGEGGDGGHRGDLWSRDGKPGKPGKPGESGAPGQPGAPGKTGEVYWDDTGDPHWVYCFGKYQELIKSGEDRDFARQFLLACNNQ